MAMSMYCVLLCLFILQGVIAVRYPLPGGPHNKRPFKKVGPYNIAHRGANGEFPESTAPSFKRAIERGADFIETDIGVTKDGVLICIHDRTLDLFTDVKQHKKFADKFKTYEYHNRNESGFFSIDFTLEEIKTLRVNNRVPAGDLSYDGLYEILTFEEYIAIALNADRVVGIDPEIKYPDFYNAHVKWEDGKLLEDIYVETLLKYGYNSPYLSKGWFEKPIFIQTFSANSILYIANKTRSPKVLNLEDYSDPQLTTDEYLDFISKYVVALSPVKTVIAPMDMRNLSPESTDFVDKAHARGLMVHAATYDNHPLMMAKDFYGDAYKEYHYFLRVLGVDALMTDYPGSLSSYLKGLELNVTDQMWS